MVTRSGHSKCILDLFGVLKIQISLIRMNLPMWLPTWCLTRMEHNSGNDDEEHGDVSGSTLEYLLHYDYSLIKEIFVSSCSFDKF